LSVETRVSRHHRPTPPQALIKSPPTPHHPIDLNAVLTRPGHHRSWSMRPWESDRPLAKERGRADSHGRMDRKTVWRGEMKKALTELDALSMETRVSHHQRPTPSQASMRSPPTPHHPIDLNAVLTRPEHHCSWSMRPWESDRPSAKERGRADSQGRMDQKSSLARRGEESVKEAGCLERGDKGVPSPTADPTSSLDEKACPRPTIPSILTLS
jgi:hypothetical protein